MKTVDELISAYATAVQERGSRSIKARELLNQLCAARNKGLRREVRASKRKRRDAA